MKAKVGDQIKKIDELVDWKKTFTNLYNSWVGQAADFTVSFLENGKTLTQSAIESWKKKIDGINSWWKGKTATFELKFDAITTDLKSWINTNVFGKIKSVFRKVDIFKKIDLSGLTFGARGGILTSATPLIAGEAGAEALVPLERNLGWLDKMANMISQKLADTSIPLIAQGNILPANSEFMQAINTSVSQTVNNSDIVNVLNSILNRLDAIDNSSNNEPIVLQLDKKVISRAVWDETNKRYKQTGRNNLIIT